MQSYKLKKGYEILKKEGYKGFLRIVHKLTKYQEETPKTMEALSLIAALDFSVAQFESNRRLMDEFEKKRPDIRSINWFIPFFHHAYYGGIYTIFRFANYFAEKKGIKTRLVLYDNPYVSDDYVTEKLKDSFPRLAEEEVFVYRGPDVNVIPYADVSVATLWTSAYQVMKFTNTRGKFYFIQDYEPLFYPAGTYYALCEATYRFGFHAIINTPGLYDYVTKTHRIEAEYFVPAVDRSIFFPRQGEPGPPGEKQRLFFYGRPQHDRNAFELAIAAAKTIKSALGDRIEIVSAGSEWDPKEYGLEGIVTNLGLLGYRQTADLYRNSDFGLIMMFTKHPSYIPFELMASGCIVFSNYNEANKWFYNDLKNCITVEPSPTYISEKLLEVISNLSLQDAIRENALKTVSGMDWDTEMEKIYKFITGAKPNGYSENMGKKYD